MQTKSPRERAACAFCRLDGHPENTKFDGKPMWQSYLAQVLPRPGICGFGGRSVAGGMGVHTRQRD